MKEHSKVIFWWFLFIHLCSMGAKHKNFKKILKMFVYLFLCLRISMTTIATIDMINIHEIYEHIKVDYPDYSEPFVYFLAACLFLDPDINLEIVLKLRTYGGLIGIENSSLDT